MQAIIPCNALYIDLNRDKFQWIFEPNCEVFYRLGDGINIKKYYQDNKDKLNTQNIEMPTNILEYLKSTEHINLNMDDRPDSYSHIVIMNDGKLSDIWMKNTCISSKIKYLQLLSNNRPLLMSMSGKAFDYWRIQQSHNSHGYGVDIAIQRANSWPRPGCIVIFYIQGILMRDLVKFDKYGHMSSDQDRYNLNVLRYGRFVHKVWLEMLMLSLRTRQDSVLSQSKLC